MKVIKDYTQFNNSELKEYIESFHPSFKKGIYRKFDYDHIIDYDMQHIQPSDELMHDIKKILKSYISNTEFIFLKCCLNRILVNTNETDGFHNDWNSGDLVLLHYPYLDFKGGELEWLEDDISNIINIEAGLNLILNNNPYHRVLNVTEGIRYSFAFFFKKINKKELL